MKAAASLVTKAMVVAVGGALMTGLSAAAQTTSLTLYTPEPLGAQATYAVSNIYANAPLGSVTLGSIPFNVANTAWAGSGQQYQVPTNAPKPLNVYILLNSSNGTSSYQGQTVGRVHLTFSDGSSQDTNLVAGGNIREWWTGGSLVSTLSNPTTSQVWEGQAQPAMGVNGTAHIDMLNVKVATTSADLTGVSIVNSAAGSYWMFVSGLTVAYDPIARPGNSQNTPAALHSQAGEHSNSANFTGTSPAQGKSTASATPTTSATPTASPTASAATATTDSDKHSNHGHSH
jgi:hypothetical protein